MPTLQPTPAWPGPAGSSASDLRACHARFIARTRPDGDHDTATIRLLGVDFTSTPRRAKPVVVAHGHLCRDDAEPDAAPVVTVTALETHACFDGFDDMLAAPGVWAGGFDLPFGLPREFVQAQDWPSDWREYMATFAGLSREALRDRFRAFCAARPVGGKFAHRQTDGPAGSSPSMKWVNPPVAWMMHAGVPRLLKAGLCLPGLAPGDAGRVALEAYPGLLARSVTRASYKSDERARQTAARLHERARIVAALEAGKCSPGLVTVLPPALRDVLVADASGDSLDAVLCLVQAGWGVARHDACFGLRPGFDTLEGWIVGAP